MKQFFVFLIVTGMSGGFVAQAGAVTLTNSDSTEQIVTVTESGKRSEVALAASESVELCEKGCFMSFPSGDMLPLKGAETVVVESGKGRIVNN